MLSKSDVQAIGMVFDQRLSKKLDLKLKPIHQDVKIIKKDVKKLQKDLKTTSNFLDVENLKAVKRIKAMEVHLGFTEPEII